MIDFDKILNDFDPGAFRRKDLRKSLLPPSSYLIQLDAYAAWMEMLLDEMQEELNEAKAQIGRAGNPQYMADAKIWGTNWNDLQRTLGTKDADLIRSDARIEVLEEKLKRKDKEIAYLYEREDIMQERIVNLQQQLLDYESGGTKVPKTRDSFGRFTNGESKKEKEQKAYFMKQEGYTWPEIGDQLDIKPDTAKQYAENYLREMKRLHTEEAFQFYYGNNEEDYNGNLE